MSIANYSELQSKIALWLRPGSGSTSGLQIADFITLFESRANRELQLRVMESNEPLTATLGERAIALPAGFIEPIGFWLTDIDPREELNYCLPDQLNVTTSAHRPQHWALDGGNIVFECPVDVAYPATFRMLKRFALSDASPTNWLLSNHPDLYLYGSLVNAAPFVRDVSMLGIWKGFVEEALEEIGNKEARSVSAAELRTDLPMGSRQGGFNINRGY